MLEIKFLKINKEGSLVLENEKIETIDFVHLFAKSKKRRAYFSPKNEGGKLLCSSWDGQNPSIGGMFEGPCSTCEKSKWGRKESKAVPPACHEIQDMVFFCPSRNELFSYGLKGTSIKQWKIYCTQCILWAKNPNSLQCLSVSFVGEIFPKRVENYTIAGFKILREVEDGERNHHIRIQSTVWGMEEQPQQVLTSYSQDPQLFADSSKEKICIPDRVFDDEVLSF